MRLSHLISVATTALLMPGIGLADAGTNTPSASGADAPAEIADDSSAEVGWDQFDDPSYVPPAIPVSAATAESVGNSAEEAVRFDEAKATVAAPKAGANISLGPVGVDGEGRTGRLHTVTRGNTLWDISAAYLGTPWVWPSVWTDNNDIDNPHLIIPGDKIWITSTEMRVVSDAEAEAFLEPQMAAVPSSDLGQPLAAPSTDPSTLDAFPVSIPGQTVGNSGGRGFITVSERERMGFLSTDDLDGASSIVDSTSARVYLVQGDPVNVGMGEGDVEVGDELAIFQVLDPIRDIGTNRLLGYHVENLGWLRVEQLTGDTSIASIRESHAEIPRGAKVIVRPDVSSKVALRDTPDAVEGQIVYMPSSRTVMADGGYVYLNRGEFHGVEVGSELEVFESGAILHERERRVDVRTPDHRVATLVVVSVEPDSAVAFVLSASRELEIGDAVRPRVTRVAAR